MLLHLGTKPVLVVSSADAAKEIMKTHDLIFASRPRLNIPYRLVYNGKDVAFSPYGEYWRQARSICVLHLLSNRMVHSFRRVREEETSDMIEKIRRKSRSSSSSSTTTLINLSDTFVTLTNDVICRVALGKKYGEEEEEGRKAKAALREFVELLGTFCVTDYLPWLSWLNRINGLHAKVERVNKEIDELMEMAIEEHSRRDCSSEDKSPNFLDILLNLQGNNSSSIPVERDTIKALILDMFAAGTDTTHSVMEWAMTELLRHPNIMKKLQNEVREVAQGKEEVTEDDIEKMHYLKAVIKETLRLHYPVALMVPHESTQDVKVMGYDVSAGTQVIVNGWSIARDPKSWENAEEFQPDRFYSDSSGDGIIDFRGLNFQFIPFGAGRRICPGVNFAIAINELGLAKLMHKFDFALPDDGGDEEKCIPESSGITVHRKFPLIVAATPGSVNVV